MATVILHFSVHQVIRKGEVSCCWICTACKDNEYVQDEFTCKACELGWWPDKELEGKFTCSLVWICTCRLRQVGKRVKCNVSILKMPKKPDPLVD